jgi:hypothetical protein
VFPAILNELIAYHVSLGDAADLVMDTLLHITNPRLLLTILKAIVEDDEFIVVTAEELPTSKVSFIVVVPPPVNISVCVEPPVWYNP